MNYYEWPNLDSEDILLLQGTKWNIYKQKLKNVMGLKNATLMQKIDADVEQIQNIAKQISNTVKVSNEISFPNNNFNIGG